MIENKLNSQHHCKLMDQYLSQNGVALVYVPRFREYGIKIVDGGTSFVIISHCPWCGCRLPTSLRNAWFDEIEKRGLDVDSNDIPSEMLTEKWWEDIKE